MFLIPKDGLKILDPMRLDFLPPEGRDVGQDQGAYWHRHIRDESVTVVADKDLAAATARLEKADRERNKVAAQEVAKTIGADQPAAAK